MGSGQLVKDMASFEIEKNGRMDADKVEIR